MIVTIPPDKRKDYLLDHYHVCDICNMESSPEDCADYPSTDCIDMICVHCQDEPPEQQGESPLIQIAICNFNNKDRLKEIFEQMTLEDMQAFCNFISGTPYKGK